MGNRPRWCCVLPRGSCSQTAQGSPYGTSHNLGEDERIQKYSKHEERCSILSATVFPNQEPNISNFKHARHNCNEQLAGGSPKPLLSLGSLERPCSVMQHTLLVALRLHQRTKTTKTSPPQEPSCTNRLL